MNWTRLKGWRFIKPDWRITAATLVFCALTLAAGNWQQNREAYKRQLQDRFDERSQAPPVALSAAPVAPQDYDQRPVSVSGTYLPKYEILIDNKVYEGRAGYQVITPLKIADSDTYVLVNRGWVAQGRTRADLPPIATPSGLQSIEGVALVPGTRFMELQSDPHTGGVWQNLSLEKYRQWSGLSLQPIVIEQSSKTADDGLVRDWLRPDFGIDKHRIYALQWFSFCGLAIFLYVFFHFKRRR